jgi:hypothetical protein
MELVMADTSPTQQLFELWRAQMEESSRAWSRLLDQSPPVPAAPPDPMTFWRPIMEQWSQAWGRALAGTPLPPDIMTQWKQFLDQSIDAWSRALGQAMNTEAFAQLLGRYLDQWLVAYGPVKKAGEQAIDAALQTLNVASRTQLTAVAHQLVELDERVDHVEDGVQTVLRRLDELARALGGGREAATKERA